MTTSDYTTNQPEFKTCTKCGESFPATAEYFYTRKNNGKLHNGCKECIRRGAKHWRETHPEKCRELEIRRRKERREYNREKSRKRYESQREECLEHQKRYYQEHREARREYNRKYRESHREEGRNRSKLWREANLDKVNTHSRNRRALSSNAPGSHTAADIQQHIKGQTDKRGNLRCWWCGKVIRGAYHVDHRIPLIRGGSNNSGNLCITHPKCNQSKKDKFPQEWIGRLI